MLRLILILHVGLMCMDIHAQDSRVYGIVTSEGIPLALVNVGIEGTTHGIATDNRGTFSIRLSPGNYTLVASFVGYQTFRKHISLEADQENELNIDLVPTAGSLDEVIISGTLKEVSRLESPVPVEVYNHTFFKANPVPSMFESLQNVNGVRPQLNCNVCNTGDIHINGLEGPYTMVLIDGMPIVSGLSTVYGLTGIPQSLIDRMEIVKGPASTLFGSEAVGGLINLITRRTDNAPRVAVDMFGTTWGEINTDVGVTYNAGKKIDGLLGINYFNYSNPIDNNNDNFTDLTLQDRISVFNKYSVQRKENRLFTIAGRYIYEDRWGGEMNWAPEYRGGNEVYGESIFTSRWELFGTYQLPVREKMFLQWSANSHNQNSVYGNSDFNASQYIGFGQFTWNKILGNHDLLFGAAYRYTYYDDNTPATFDGKNNLNEPSAIHLPGFFVQDEISLNKQHKLLLGLRYDVNSLHGSILTPRINYKWSSGDGNNTIRISAGNGYRVANVFTEDHAALTGARDVIFEEELKPETSWNMNINYVRQLPFPTKFITIDATAFYTYFTNRILPDYETNPNQIRYGNLDGYSVSRGISVNVDAMWDNGLKVLGGITVMDVSVEEESVRKRQLLTESFQGVWTIGYTFSGARLTVDYTGNVFGPMRLPLLGQLDPRDEYSPWYSIQNIQVTKKFGKQWEIYGGIKNLLNFTPASNSIARPFDPFDKNVDFDANGQVIPSPGNPYALTFDPSYVYASNQGIRGFLGMRYSFR